MTSGNLVAGIEEFMRYRIPDFDDRKDLKATPERVYEALLQMTSGHDDREWDVEQLLRLFPIQCDEMVLVRGIQFASLCEHHLMPFFGEAHVAYLPDPARGVVGLSKLSRLVSVYAKRLQVQERLTVNITGALDRYVTTRGSACVIRATHGCMSCRGVNQPMADTITSSLTGHFRVSEVRAELLSLIGDLRHA